MLLATSLPAWDRDRALYQPLARTCATVAVACLGLAAIRPAPLILGLALVLLLSIPGYSPPHAAWPIQSAHPPGNTGVAVGSSVTAG
jgi:hypothetical protein